MSATAISGDLREYAVRRWPTANHKFRKSRLADILGLSERRVRSYWEANVTAPRVEEVEAIKALIGRQEEVNAEDQALTERVAALEAQIALLVSALDGDEAAADRAAAYRKSQRSRGRSYDLPRRRADD